MLYKRKRDFTLYTFHSFSEPDNKWNQKNRERNKTNNKLIIHLIINSSLIIIHLILLTIDGIKHEDSCLRCVKQLTRICISTVEFYSSSLIYTSATSSPFSAWTRATAPISLQFCRAWNSSLSLSMYMSLYAMYIWKEFTPLSRTNVSIWALACVMQKQWHHLWHRDYQTIKISTILKFEHIFTILLFVPWVPTRSLPYAGHSHSRLWHQRESGIFHRHPAMTRSSPAARDQSP